MRKMVFIKFVCFIVCAPSLFIPVVVQAGDTIDSGPISCFTTPGKQIRFRYPSTFKIGKEFYGSTEKEGRIVLVEPNQLRKYSLEAIPVGEIPAIRIDCETGEAADYRREFTDLKMVERFFSTEIPQQQFERTINGYKVYHLPAAPGPYGDLAHYYIVVIGKDVLVIGANKYYFRDKKDPISGQHRETRYDETIEAILPTIDLMAEKTLNKPQEPLR